MLDIQKEHLLPQLNKSYSQIGDTEAPVSLICWNETQLLSDAIIYVINSSELGFFNFCIVTELESLSCLVETKAHLWHCLRIKGFFFSASASGCRILCVCVNVDIGVCVCVCVCQVVNGRQKASSAGTQRFWTWTCSLFSSLWPSLCLRVHHLLSAFCGFIWECQKYLIKKKKPIFYVFSPSEITDFTLINSVQFICVAPIHNKST